jgi:hypothetical protein
MQALCRLCSARRWHDLLDGLRLALEEAAATCLHHHQDYHLDPDGLAVE